MTVLIDSDEWTRRNVREVSTLDTVEVSAKVSVEAKFGGEVLSYVRLQGHDPSVVFVDSVTRRVCHVTSGDCHDGDEDLWVPVAVAHRGVAFFRQEVYVFPDEGAARDALAAIGKPPRSSVVQFRAGHPLWHTLR